MKSVFQQLARQHTHQFRSLSQSNIKTSISLTDVDVQFQFLLQFMNLSNLQISQITDTLKAHGFVTYQSKNQGGDKPLLFIALTDPAIILEQAELMHIYKLVIDRPHQPIHEVYRKIHEKLNIKRILDEKLVNRLNNLDRRILLYENYAKFKYCNKADFSLHDDDQEVIKIFSQSEILLIIYNYLHQIKIGDLDIIHFLKSENYLISISPIHEEQIIIKQNQDIERYFGANVAIYFEFMNYYQDMLKYLSLFAVIALIIDHSKLDISNIASFYALFTMSWTTIFIIFWYRKENELGIEWGILGGKSIKQLDLNPEFKGQPRIRIHNGLLTQSYPKSNRYFYYFISLFEALPILIIAGYIKILVFNINGLIKNKQSIFYIQSIASLNQINGILHYSHTGSILDILSILLIFYINVLYTKVCINSTKRENHKTNLRFYNSVILKRFLFELINRFFHLFYIAFGEFDIPSLKNQLTKLFIMDQIRRVGLESLIPLLLKEKNKKKSKNSEEQNEKFIAAITELELWEYDDFDDYIEVIFQYGYIVLFAAIFPMAAPLTYIFNFIEIWSDKFKLMYDLLKYIVSNKLYQRNLPKKTNSIGQWRIVIVVLSVLSIYTNTAFISFQYFNLFETCQGGDCDWENILILLFVFEHISLGLKYAITQSVGSMPKWVRVVQKRMKHRKL